MIDLRAIEFSNSDKDYLTWIRNHPDGLVLNTTRPPTQNYLVLHKAGCSTISQYGGEAKPGGFTEREYIKICSDSEEGIRSWVRGKGFSSNAITKGCYCWKDDDW